MRLFRIGFMLALITFVTPLFASQCPSADEVRSCKGGQCNFQRLAGWSLSIYYSDQEKPFIFQKEQLKHTEDGNELSCFYTYVVPETHKEMPHALALRKMVS
jgi:hypothetical protein